MYNGSTNYKHRNVNGLGRGVNLAVSQFGKEQNLYSLMTNFDSVNKVSDTESISLTWDKKLSIGIDNIDKQNKEIFNYINKLIYHIKFENSENRIIEAFDFLENFMIKHFNEEEAIQKEKKYPKYKLQQKEHEKLKRVLKELRSVLINQQISSTVDFYVQRKMLYFFKKHIINLDKEFGEFLIKEYRGEPVEQ